MNKISRGSVFSVGYRLYVVLRVRGSNLKGGGFYKKNFRNIWETLVNKGDWLGVLCSLHSIQSPFFLLSTIYLINIY